MSTPTLVVSAEGSTYIAIPRLRPKVPSANVCRVSESLGYGDVHVPTAWLTSSHAAYNTLEPRQYLLDMDYVSDDGRNDGHNVLPVTVVLLAVTTVLLVVIVFIAAVASVAVLRTAHLFLSGATSVRLDCRAYARAGVHPAAFIGPIGSSGSSIQCLQCLVV